MYVIMVKRQGEHLQPSVCKFKSKLTTYHHTNTDTENSGNTSLLLSFTINTGKNISVPNMTGE